MNQKNRIRARNLTVFAASALLYMILSTSLAFNDFLTVLIGSNFFSLNLLLMTMLIIMSAASLIINVYSYGIFKEFRYLLFAVASFELTIAYFFQLMNFVSPQLGVGFLQSDYGQISLVISLAILMVLSIKLAFIRNNLTLELPLRYVPVILLMVGGGMVGLYLLIRSGVSMNDTLMLAILMILVFMNMVGYIIKYFLDGDENAKTVLFVGIIHLATFMVPDSTQNLTIGQEILQAFFRLISISYMTFWFYKQLFSSYTEEVAERDEERNTYLEVLEKTVDERTRDYKAIVDTLNREINSAKELQRSMMPPKELIFPGVNFVCENIPAERMSGDFFDIYEIGEDRIGMYILDVSGHGINAALMNVYIYNYIRSTDPRGRQYLGDNPSSNLRHLYDQFNQMGFPDEMHLVLFIASYNRKTGLLTYASGGLNTAPILVRRDGEIKELDQAKGFPITKMGDFFHPEYIEAEIQLLDGDRILFYTDGLIDERQPFRILEEDAKEILLETMDETLQTVDRVFMNRIEPEISRLIDDVSFFLMEVGS